MPQTNNTGKPVQDEAPAELVEPIPPELLAKLGKFGRDEIVRAINGGYVDADFFPDESGLLLARVLQGKARLWWELVPADNEVNRLRGTWVADQDLDQAKRILDALASALETGTQEVLVLLEHVARKLQQRAPKDSLPKRLADYVGDIAVWADRLRDHNWDNSNELHFCAQIRDLLAAHDDAAFATLGPEQLRKALRGISPSRTGGAWNAGAVQAAAELAVHVNAFGLGDGEGQYAEKVAKANAKIAQARSRFRRQTVT